MKTTQLLLSFLVTSTFINAAELSPELQVLNRFLGTWDSQVTNLSSGDVTKTVETRTWSKKGYFVISEDSNADGSNESFFLMTYDPNLKFYRTCFINQFDTAPIIGKWDERTQTMTWNGMNSFGNTLSGTHRFIDKDNVQWNLTFRDQKGVVTLKLSTKQTRRKK